MQDEVFLPITHFHRPSIFLRPAFLTHTYVYPWLQRSATSYKPVHGSEHAQIRNRLAKGKHAKVTTNCNAQILPSFLFARHENRVENTTQAAAVSNGCINPGGGICARSQPKGETQTKNRFYFTRLLESLRIHLALALLNERMHMHARA